MTVCTRFAPSPTGALHIGSVRTALFAWLYARHHGGKFILRIEDTDLERSTEASRDAILAGMHWLGLGADEGPFYQSQRLSHYQQAVQKLLDDGLAYRCQCSKERLTKLREQQMSVKQKPRYDGLCCDKGLTEADGPAVIRFRHPQTGTTKVLDAVHGQVQFNNNELDDLVIMRADGVPTYHLSVVVDDAMMGVTHVIRGDDHLANTPRQIGLIQALGYPVPHYTHIPMILGPDGKRFSKRHGAQDILSYQAAGFLPQAMRNYLVRLGWSHGDDEIFTLDEMIQYFDLKALNKAAASFDPDKLLWLNQHYIQQSQPEQLLVGFTEQLQQLNLKLNDTEQLIAVIKAQQARSKTLAEMAEKSAFIWCETIEYDQQAISKHFKSAVGPAYHALVTTLESLSSWNEQAIHDVLESIAQQFELKLGKIAQPVRIAVTGSTVSPSINTTLVLLGRGKSLLRLNHAKQYFKATD